MNESASRPPALDSLHDITLDLIHRRDLQAVLDTLLANMGPLLRSPSVSVDLLDGPDMIVTYAATPGQPLEVGDRMARGEGGFLTWQAIDSRAPVTLEDYSAWAQRRTLFEGYPIRAILIVPILYQQEVVGALNFLRLKQGDLFTQEDINIGVQLAKSVGLALENARIYTLLHERVDELARTSQELRDSQDQVIQQQREIAQIEERQRMGRDLHDSVSQSLHSLLLIAETLSGLIEKGQTPDALRLTSQLQETARQAIKETRLMLFESRSPLEEAAGDLPRALQARLDSVERRAGLRTRLTASGPLNECAPEIRDTLYWAATEGLNNALKHAQARQVLVTLAHDRQRVWLEVRDDGIGFNPAHLPGGGLGLSGAAERAALVNGKLEVKSAPGSGTSFSLTIPLEHTDA